MVEKAKSRDFHTFHCSITPQQGPFVNPIKIASHIATEAGDQTLTLAISTLENSDKNLDALKAALKSVTGKDVALNVKVDPSIIGGLVVKLGSRMVDSSLRTKLNSIKNAMKEAG